MEDICKRWIRDEMRAPPDAFLVADFLLVRAKFQCELASLAANRAAAARAHVSGAAALALLILSSSHSLARAQVSLPQHIDANGLKVREVAHSADLLRLRLMRDVGGVYMDADVITVKSFDPLLKVRRLQRPFYGVSSFLSGQFRHGPRGRTR